MNTKLCVGFASNSYFYKVFTKNFLNFEKNF